MTYNYHFEDSKDIEECRQYLVDTFRFNPYSMLIDGNRFFEITLTKNEYDRVYMRLLNDKRIANVSTTKKYDYCKPYLPPYQNEQNIKYTVRAKILPKNFENPIDN